MLLASLTNLLSLTRFIQAGFCGCLETWSGITEACAKADMLINMLESGKITAEGVNERLNNDQ